MSAVPHGGMDLRQALQVAEGLGLVVERIRRTGEIRVRFPWRPAPLRLNGRRKDASRKLTSLLRQHQERIT